MEKENSIQAVRLPLAYFRPDKEEPAVSPQKIGTSGTQEGKRLIPEALRPFYRVVEMQVSGKVCAGFPSPAEEELRDIISFDEYLVGNPETSFLLSVTGDSMSGAGIMENDLVIVQRGRQPKNGDIILAEVDGNWTMKYFRRKGKAITLEAANPKYPPIVPQEELRIAGVVTALVRKYHK
jgi:repressor LexA